MPTGRRRTMLSDIQQLFCHTRPKCQRGPCIANSIWNARVYGHWERGWCSSVESALWLLRRRDAKCHPRLCTKGHSKWSDPPKALQGANRESGIRWLPEFGTDWLRPTSKPTRPTLQDMRIEVQIDQIDWSAKPQEDGTHWHTVQCVWTGLEAILKRISNHPKASLWEGVCKTPLLLLHTCSKPLPLDSIPGNQRHLAWVRIAMLDLSIFHTLHLAGSQAFLKQRASEAGWSLVV